MDTPLHEYLQLHGQHPLSLGLSFSLYMQDKDVHVLTWSQGHCENRMALQAVEGALSRPERWLSSEQPG